MRKSFHPTLLRAAPKSKASLIERITGKKKLDEPQGTAQPKSRTGWRLTKRSRTLG